jgi:hypothetical protein
VFQFIEGGLKEGIFPPQVQIPTAVLPTIACGFSISLNLRMRYWENALEPALEDIRKLTNDPTQADHIEYLT